jgi:hypothetical protein
MSLVFVRLRWDDVDAERFEEIARTVPQGDALPTGCLSRQLERQGNVLMATETWDSQLSGGRMDQLVTAVAEAGIDRSPQTAMFSVPAIFGAAYRRPAPRPEAAAEADTEALAAAIPQQRAAAVEEQLEETGTPAAG